MEIGCGVGWGSYYLAKKFTKAKFLSTNIDEKSIDYASKIYSRENLSFTLADGLNQEKFCNKFDLVYFLEVLEHFDQNNQVHLIKESLASLKSGGLIIFSTPSREFSYGFPTLGWVVHQMEYHSREQLLKFLLNSTSRPEFKTVEVNRLVDEQFARRKRLVPILLFPFICTGHLLHKKGWEFSFIRRFVETRKLLSPSVNKLSLAYQSGLSAKTKRQTMTLIAVIEKK